MNPPTDPISALKYLLFLLPFVLLFIYLTYWPTFHALIGTIRNTRKLNSHEKRKIMAFLRNKRVSSVLKSKLGKDVILLPLLSKKVLGLAITYKKRPLIFISPVILDKQFTDQERQWLLLHEAGHFVLKHKIKLSLLEVVFGLLALFAIGPLFTMISMVILLFTTVFLNFPFILGLPEIALTSLNFLLATILMVILYHKAARRLEAGADKFAAKNMDDPKAMITITEKLKKANFGYKNPILRKFFLSGTTYEERIKIAEEEIQRRKK